MDCAADATRTECGPGAAAYENKMMSLEMGSLLGSIDCGELTLVGIIFLRIDQEDLTPLHTRLLCKFQWELKPQY